MSLKGQFVANNTIVRCVKNEPRAGLANLVVGQYYRVAMNSDATNHILRVMDMGNERGARAGWWADTYDRDKSWFELAR